MAVAIVNQTKDVEVVVISRRFGLKPSFLVLNSASIVRGKGEAALRDTSALSVNLANAINSIGRESVKLAQDYLTPGKPEDVNNLKDAFNLLRGLNGQLNAMLSNVFPAGNQLRMAAEAVSEMGDCFAYVIDHSYGLNSARAFVAPGDPIFGFFAPAKSTRINALIGQILPDISGPSQFMVYGKR
jgi:hypothetical protein